MKRGDILEYTDFIDEYTTNDKDRSMLEYMIGDNCIGYEYDYQYEDNFDDDFYIRFAKMEAFISWVDAKDAGVSNDQ